MENNGNYKLGFFESVVFKGVMENSLKIQDLSEEMTKFIRANAGRQNAAVIRMRKALQQYLDRTEDYMDFIGRTDKLSYADYSRLLNFVESMKSINIAYAKFLASSFGKVLDEEVFPVLKCTEEYKKLMTDLAALEASIKCFGDNARVIGFIENNWTGIASRNVILYNANPVCKSYDNSDENLNRLASNFYMNCLKKTGDTDVFMTMARNNAFDDFVKEESLKNNQSPKLKLTKKN